jgi:peptide/nickel transport system substrate-binding protein
MTAYASVILSGAATSRSEVAAESKDPYSPKNAKLSLPAGGFVKSLSVLLLCLTLLGTTAYAQGGGELHFCLRNEPKTFDPLLVDDDSSLSIRYLTGGVLIRANRKTQHLEPELAESWNLSRDGKQITFKLRHGIHFSDGTPFSSDDVAYTMQRLMDPNLHSSTGDAFRSGTGAVTTMKLAPDQITVIFPAPVVGLDALFDQVAIMSTHSPKKEGAVLGPFMVAEYKAGSSVLLKRNPNYWKKDAEGHHLPYLDSISLDIQPNRDVEMLRFKRGELDLINVLDSDYFDKLASTSPQLVHDAGASLDAEFMWFNQVASAPIPPYKRAWFRSTNFRRAISQAISRDDLSRIVYNGHAQPAVGPVSPANKFWFNSRLHAEAHNPAAALKRLEAEGFHLQDGTLKDKDGNAVEFSIVTNASSKPRERMAVLMQEDLGKIGIKVNVVTLDFPSLLERISQKFNYEAAILGFRNVDLDPNGQMNIWLSSAENHAWNPQQKAPETAWEAEIDKLMRVQASASDPKKRKLSFDRVQEIVYEQAPFIYLINQNALSAISTSVAGANPVILHPQTFWNAERITRKDNTRASR